MSYSLTNAESQNALYPATFHIPPHEARMNLHVGDTIKIIFNTKSDLFAERMWVRITQVVERGKYVGTLESHPQSPHIFGLSHGDTVEFEAKHIIDIYERPN